MDFKGIRVLVLDGYAKQMVGILGQLHDLGCVVTTLCFSKLDTGYNSRFAAKKILEPRAKEDSSYLAEVIVREVNSGNYDAIFPMLEKATEIIYCNRHLFTKPIHIMAAEEGAFKLAYDKQKTLEICQKNDIPCPITKMDCETLEDYLSRVEFPLIVKPRKGTGSVGFRFLENRQSIEELLKLPDFVLEEYVLQEYIPHDRDRYACYMFLDADQEMKSVLVADIYRSFPLDAGPACYLGTVDDERIVEWSYRLLKNMKWSGFAQVGYIEDPRDGIPKILEINGRIPASFKLSSHCGINAVRQILEYSMGEPVTELVASNRHPVNLRQIQTDVLYLIKSKEPFKKKIKWFDFRHNRDYIFSWKDPIPSLMYSIQCLTRYKADMAKKEHTFSGGGYNSQK